MSKIIPHSKPFVSEDEVLAVAEVVKSGMHGTFDKTKEFENKMCALIGMKYAKAVNSGTNALHLALLSLGIGESDEVIIPSYVCASVKSAVNYTRAKVILADIDPDYEKKGYNISSSTIKKVISKKTKAIIVPHMFGTPADLDEILKLGIPVVEDCAQSLGAFYKGKRVGSFGLISIFSFYATKIISTGHGGMILTSAEKIINKIEDLTKYDGREEYDISYNYGFTDIQAVLGIKQLEKLDKFIERRREISLKYDNAFNKIGLDVFPSIKESFPFRYVIKLKNREERWRLQEKLREKRIKVEQPVFKPLHQYLGFSDDDFPNTSEAHDCVLSIPIYPALRDEDIGYIVMSVKQCYEK